MVERWKKFQFLFVELVKRDFKKKIQAHFLWHAVEHLFPTFTAACDVAGIFSIFWGPRATFYDLSVLW